MKMNVLTACIRLAVVIGAAIMPAAFGETPEEEEWHKKGYETPDADEAIGFHTKAILANPNFAFGYLGRGRAKIRKKDFDGAIKDFTRAI
ncbi:MAG: hypothetical protein GY862_33465, partial [Gammaproteobacteria bacterium]|nr:hypothetical protein [Gammaproteobacteria bacterium]